MRLSGMCLSVLLMFASVPCFAQEPTESDIATMYPLSPVVTHGVSPSTPDALGYEYKGTTDRGVVRSKNEDSFWIDGANGVFLVADGMGGARSGRSRLDDGRRNIATMESRDMGRRSFERLTSISHDVDARRLSCGECSNFR